MKYCVLRLFEADLFFQELILNLESLDLPSMVWKLTNLLIELWVFELVFQKRFNLFSVQEYFVRERWNGSYNSLIHCNINLQEQAHNHLVSAVLWSLALLSVRFALWSHPCRSTRVVKEI